MEGSVTVNILQSEESTVTLKVGKSEMAGGIRSVNRDLDVRE